MRGCCAIATTRIKVNDFIKASRTYVEKSLKKANANKNAYLSPAEQKKLPKGLRDNFKNYVAATRQVWSTESAVKDKTSPTRIAQHLAAYGVSAVPYSDAFAKGVKAVLADRDYGPGGVLKDIGDGNGNELTDAQIRAQLEQAFKSMTLLPVGESSESGFDPRRSGCLRSTPTSAATTASGSP